MAYIVVVYIVMAYIGMVDVFMAYVVMTYVVMASAYSDPYSFVHIVIDNMVMADTAVAYIVFGR